MEKQYFYVKPKDSFPPKLPENTIYKIDIDEINALASFALTLKPIPEITEAFGYVAALSEYSFSKNSMLHKIYEESTANSEGESFLCTTIELCLLEKEFRKDGITKDKIEKYNKAINDYHKQLLYNNAQYSIGQTTRKK